METPKKLSGRFVHVVARVDLAKRTGRILYVNPATTGVKLAAGSDPTVRLRFASADGAEIAWSNPVLHLASCEARAASRSALIQEDVELVSGMTSIELQVDGNTVDSYTAGKLAADAPPKKRNLTAKKLQGASPFAGPKMQLETAGLESPAVDGVSYTVQAKPTPAAPWTTLAVGGSTPSVTVDANQFPGSKSVIVRVLRTNGFFEDVVAEDVVKF